MTTVPKQRTSSEVVKKPSRAARVRGDNSARQPICAAVPPEGGRTGNVRHDQSTGQTDSHGKAARKVPGMEARHDKRERTALTHQGKGRFKESLPRCSDWIGYVEHRRRGIGTRSRPFHNISGFTLIEVLIATTLLGVMMLLLFGSLRIGVTSWDSGEDKMARASRLFLVENFLRNHIESALPLVEMEESGGGAIPLKGGEDWLEYVSTMPPQVRAGGLYRFRLYVAKNGQRNDLKVAMRPYVSNPNSSEKAQPAEPIEDVLLLENLGQITFSYLPENLQTAQPVNSTWLPEWRKGQLPMLIQVKIEPEDEEPWPALVIALRTRQ